MSWNHNIWLVFFSEYLQITCSFDASSVDRLKTVVMHHQSWLVWTLDTIRFSGACLYDGSTSISRHTERKPHWLDESFSLHVSFIFYSFVHLFNQIFIMPHASRDQGHSASRERVVHPTHEWCSSHAASERGSSAYRDPESSRTKRLDKHDPQTNAQGLIPMTSCEGCLVQRMKTKTFSFTPRDTVMDDVNADHMWHVSLFDWG